jgi:uncharacterized protein related to proFAR isomerase
MDIIPVIDVAHGVVVRAKRGDRANYKPIETPLSASTDPAAVAKALTALYPFSKIYLADLDGIEGRGRNVHLVPSHARHGNLDRRWHRLARGGACASGGTCDDAGDRV